MTCLKQKEEGTCLGTALTAADAAYVFSSSQLSTPEEGDTLTCVLKVGSHLLGPLLYIRVVILYNFFVFPNFNFREDHFLLGGTPVYPLSIWEHHSVQESHQHPQVL